MDILVVSQSSQHAHGAEPLLTCAARRAKRVAVPPGTAKPFRSPRERAATILGRLAFILRARRFAAGYGAPVLVAAAYTAFVVVAGYTAFVVTASLWPKPPMTPEVLRIPHMDKAVHVLIYAGYALVLRYATGQWRNAADAVGRARWPILAYCTAFGAGMELLQGCIPCLVRSFSFADMAANLAGAAMGVFIPAPVRGRDS